MNRFSSVVAKAEYPVVAKDPLYGPSGQFCWPGSLELAHELLRIGMSYTVKEDFLEDASESFVRTAAYPINESELLSEWGNSLKDTSQWGYLNFLLSGLYAALILEWLEPLSVTHTANFSKSKPEPGKQLQYSTWSCLLRGLLNERIGPPS